MSALTLSLALERVLLNFMILLIYWINYQNLKIFDLTVIGRHLDKIKKSNSYTFY